ncbi:Outer membrane protein A [Anaerolineae bacterium]|nr:Outer membrane protein A [Anaerolineae bacterium]
MKASHTNKLVLGIATLTAVSGLGMSTAYAHISEKQGYVTDTRGNVIRNSHNLCVRTGYWTPAMAIAECDPNLVKKEEPKVATPRPAPAPAPAPAALAPVVTPPRAPAPVVAVAPPAKKKLTLSADSLFDFDKATIKPQGTWSLDKFVSDLKNLEYDVITVTGHADRIGSPKYNMKLSERRAEAVKAYLVKQGGIDPSKITAIGKGETEPVTKPGQCRGQKVTKELVACKAPDRRVEVEVSGLK